MDEERAPDRAAEAASRVTEFAIRRRVTILMILLTILVVGFVAATGIPLEIFPRGYTGQHITIWAPWPDAPTREVMDKVAIPIEDEMSTVRGIEEIRSWSRVGGCSVHLTFKQGVDMDVAYREVKDRVERARRALPDDVDRLFLFREDASGIPVMVVGLIIDPELTDYYDLIQRGVIRSVERVDGVARVRADGLQEKDILIEIDRGKVEANGLNLWALTQELQGDNFTMASGHVFEGGRKLLLRSVARYRSLDEIRNRRLNAYVRLKDVAEVSYREPEKRFRARVNGKPAVAMVILKEGEANTVNLCRRLRALLKRMEGDPRFQGLEMFPIFDQGQVVWDSLMRLVKGGVMGGCLAGIVLFVFLRRARMTLLIALAIPLSLVIALGVMFFAGQTLNIITMLGLFIGVGMLVDNSIVVAENIYRLYESGVPRRKACVQGSGEIALAITMATLTTVVVFVPAALVEGAGRFFLVRLALPVTVALLGSLLVAVMFVPLGVYLILPRRRSADGAFRRWHQRMEGLLDRLYGQTLGRLNRGYNLALRFFLRRRLDLVLLLAAAVVATWVYAFRKLEFVPQQEEDQTNFQISIEASEEYSLDDIKRYFEKVDRILAAKKEALHLRGYFTLCYPTGGRIEGWLEENRPPELTAKEVGKRVLDALPRRPGLKFNYGREVEGKDAKNRSVALVRLEGNDPDILYKVTEQIEPIIRKIPGVLGVRKGEENQPRELGLVIDRSQTRAVGANPRVVAGLIAYALRGASLPRYIHEGREVPVRIRFREADRRLLADLLRLRVPTASNEAAPLGALVHPVKLHAPKAIQRINKRLTHTFAVELDPKRAKEAQGALWKTLFSLDLPEGIWISVPQKQSVQEEMLNMISAGLLSIVFIYLLMGFLFESFTLPLSILLTIPLAGIGVGWIHRIVGRDIDFLGAVAIVLLGGVVVNNGIVLIDYVNRLRARGLPRNEAILTAAARRFRPIMMTALTTIIGMIPLAVGKPTDIGISYKSFGITLIGGMSAASLLTLLVVPVFYTFLDDARRFVAAACATRFRKKSAPPPDASVSPVHPLS